MDSKVEDKIVRQIEKSLSNQMNENLHQSNSTHRKDNLFQSGRTYDKDNLPVVNPGHLKENRQIMTSLQQDASGTAFDYHPETVLSREEYIRQARESCIRQLSTIQRSSQKAYDLTYYDDPSVNSEVTNRKRARALHLFHDDNTKEENTPQEIAAFRFLMIRMVCAIVIFLSIFLIDKFDFTIGSFNTQIVEEYVTGNDTLQQLENIIMTWLK